MHLFKMIPILTASALFGGLLSAFPTAPVSAEILSEGMCGDAVTWSLSDDGMLTLSGSGETYDYPVYTDIPWLNLIDSVTAVTVETGITVLGDYLFAELPYLADVSLPDGLTRIGNSCFSRCISLDAVDFPDTLTAIGDHSFYQTALTEVFLPDSLSQIGYEAFGRCGSLRSFETLITNPYYLASEGVLYSADMQMLVRYPIALSGGVYTVPDVACIGAAAFADTAFTSVTIPSSVREIGVSAFAGCDLLTAVRFSYGLRSIGNQAFRFCTSLYDVTLPNSLQSMGVDVFQGCMGLAVIQLPFRLTEVYHESFYTPSLNTVYAFADSYTAYVAEYFGYGVQYLGEMNGDGTVNTDDAVAVLKMYSQSLLGTPVTNTRQRRLADLNLSGTVDLLDAVAILRYDSQKMMTDTPDWGQILP